MGRRFAGILGLVAFAAIVVRGVIHGSGLQGTLWVALPWLWIGVISGWTLGSIAQKVIEDSVTDQIATELAAQEARPTPNASRGRNRTGS